MWDGEFQKHTTCISEAEKYEKTLYKGDKKKGKGQQQQQQHAQQQQSQKQPPSASAQVQPSKTEQPVASTSTIPAPEGKPITCGDDAVECWYADCKLNS